MAVFTFPPSRPHFGLPRTLGHWAPGSRFPHSSLRIDVCILWNLHNRSDTLDTVKLLVPPWWSGWIRMSCDWLDEPARADLVWRAGEIGAGQHVVAVRISVSWPGWRHNMLFCFATSISQGWNEGWGGSAGKHVMPLHGIDLRAEQPCYMREIQLGFHSTQLSFTIVIFKTEGLQLFFKIYVTLWHGQLICIIC